jgi:hypothetical protein
MDVMVFRGVCAQIEQVSVGDVRALRERLRMLDARIEGRARIDVRGEELDSCVQCGATALQRFGATRPECGGFAARPVGARSVRPPERRWRGFAIPRGSCRGRRTCRAGRPAPAGVSRPGADAVLCSDGNGAYDLFARARAAPHHRLNAKTGPRVIHRALHPFCGPATKHLPRHTAWFIARCIGDETTATGAAWNRLLAA